MFDPARHGRLTDATDLRTPPEMPLRRELKQNFKLVDHAPILTRPSSDQYATKLRAIGAAVHRLYFRINRLYKPINRTFLSQHGTALLMFHKISYFDQSRANLD